MIRDGAIAGRVTSAARSAAVGAIVGLAYVHPDDAEPGRSFTVKLEDGSTRHGRPWRRLPFYDPGNAAAGAVAWHAACAAASCMRRLRRRHRRRPTCAELALDRPVAASPLRLQGAAARRSGWRGRASPCPSRTGPRVRPTARWPSGWRRAKSCCWHPGPARRRADRAPRRRLAGGPRPARAAARLPGPARRQPFLVPAHRPPRPRHAGQAVRDRLPHRPVRAAAGRPDASGRACP